MTPSTTRRHSSSSQQLKTPNIIKSNANPNINSSSISNSMQMSGSNSSAILSIPDSAELNISQCSNISVENNKIKQRKQVKLFLNFL